MNGTGNVAYFLFDPHFRNYSGIADTESGFSILAKFDNLFQVERYIEGRVLYQSLEGVSFLVEFTHHIFKSSSSQLKLMQMILQ